MTIDESARRFTSDERSVAEYLAAQGAAVEALPEAQDAKNPDALVDRRPTEFKTPRAPSVNAVTQNIKRAKLQASDVVIDGRRVGLSHGTARQGLADAVRKYGNQLTSVQVLGPDFQLRWPPGES